LWKYWKAACLNLGIKKADLFEGIRHSTTTWRAVEFGREKAKKSSCHETNKAFDLYCQVDGFKSFEIVRATAKKKASWYPCGGCPPKEASKNWYLLNFK
jgi:hypothetical protein